jgi:hypothetical protein
VASCNRPITTLPGVVRSAAAFINNSVSMHVQHVLQLTSSMVRDRQHQQCVVYTQFLWHFVSHRALPSDPCDTSLVTDSAQSCWTTYCTCWMIAKEPGDRMHNVWPTLADVINVS